MTRKGPESCLIPANKSLKPNVGLLWPEQGLAYVMDPRSACMSAVPHPSADEQGTSATTRTGSAVLEMDASSCCARDLACAGSGWRKFLL